MKALDPVCLIEAAYRVDLSSHAWLEEIVAAAEAVAGVGRGALAFTYDATKRDWVAVIDVAARGLSGEFLHALLNVPTEPDVNEGIAAVYRSVAVNSLRTAPFPASVNSYLGSVLDRFGVEDLLGGTAVDPTARGCMLGVIATSRFHSPRTVQLWRRLAAHVAAGTRLRRSLERLAADGHDTTRNAEAIISDKGRVEHAVGPAKERAGLERIRAALAVISAARGRDLPPERAVDVWEALIAGRWSIVEHFERDGKRYYLAHRNDPELAADRGLTPRERQVLAYAELGQSNKMIAYSLGLSISAVSTVLTRAHRKLGLAAAYPVSKPKVEG
jgi:DNA-binding CsgD family transcriptional regulator